MTKHSKHESSKRAAETARLKEIEAAWWGSVDAPVAKKFSDAVAAARARPPMGPPPNQQPGTRPNPPRREPRPTKEERNARPRY